MKKNKKCLLQINITANWGSTGKIAEQIGKIVKNEGWRSIIAYGRKANISENELLRIGTEASVIEHGFESLIFDNHGLGSRLATIKFIRKIDAIEPDIIHLHNIHDYYLNYKILFNYLSKKNIPVVWTLHDCWPFTGHCAHFDYAGCDMWKTECHKPCPCLNQYPKSILFDQSSRNWKLKRQSFTSLGNMTLVPVSNWLGNLVSESFLKQYTRKVIYNGIDLNVFQAADDVSVLKKKYHLEDKKVLIGVASAWNDRKGFHDYIELSERLPVNNKLVLIGLNDKQRRALPSHILGLGRTATQKELVMWYTLAEIVLNLSYEESFGLTTVEGMACGTPSIAYNATASPELISKDTGVVVEPHDIKGVLDAIAEIQTKGKKSYIKACRNRAISLFNKDDRFADYLNLYNNLTFNL